MGIFICIILTGEVGRLLYKMEINLRFHKTRKISTKCKGKSAEMTVIVSADRLHYSLKLN